MRAIGLVGLGAMGAPMALALRTSGVDLIAFDAVEATRTAAAEQGVPVATSLDELATSAEVVVLSLPTPAVVREVVAALWGASPDLVICDTSTIDPGTAVTLAAQGRYADTPILGRPASVGNWTIPVGCSDEIEPTVVAALAPLARRIVRVGGSGTAATLKVCNNLMLSAINAVTAEALALAEAAGLAPETFVDVVLESGAASVSGMFRDVAPRAVAGRFEPVFSATLMRKDAQLALDLAEQLSVPLRVVQASQHLNDDAIAAGLGAEDSITVLKTLRPAP